MLADLFARFHSAKDDYRAQTVIVDSYDGPVPDRIWQSQFDKSNAIYAVVLEICAYRPVDGEETNQKARFLLAWAETNEGLEPDEVKSLLTSMIAPPVDKSNNGEN